MSDARRPHLPRADGRDASVLADRYAVDELIGSGGMGVVFGGRDLATGERVAIKRLHARYFADPMMRLSMAHEVRAMARLRHPGVVRVIDFGWSGATPFLIMERVDGRPLSAWVEADIAFPLVRALGMHVLATLAHAHARGVVHLDLKPANVLVTGPTTAKIVDFGIARLEDAHAGVSTFGDARSSRDGESTDRRIRGSRPFMAPEQASGVEARIGPASDLFAVGVTLFLLASGKAPFKKRPIGAPLAEIARIAPRPFVPRFAVPRELDGFLADLLRGDSFLRGEFAADYLHRLAAMPHEGEPVLPEVPAEPRQALPRDAGEAFFQPTDAWTGLDSEDAPSDDEAPTRALGSHGTEILSASTGGARPPDTAAPSPSVEAERAARLGSRFGLFGIREPHLLGRAEEQAALLEPAALVLQKGRLAVRIVRGGPGVGKSRLARWIQQRSREDGSFDGLVAVYGRGRGAGGLRGAIARWLRVKNESQREVMQRAIDRLGCSTLEAYSLSSLLRPGDRRPDRAAREVLATLVHTVRRIASARPVLFWMEDADQALGGSAYQTIQALVAADEAEPLPVYVVVTEGDAPLAPTVAPLADAARALAPVRTIEVPPLADAALAALATDLLPLTPTSAASLVGRARGNPLCAMHLLAHWAETYKLEATAEGLVAPRWDGVPDALADVLAARVDGLAEGDDDPERAREILERVAVLGRAVDLDLLERSLELEGRADLVARVAPSVDAWLSSGLLRESEPRVLEVEPRALEPLLRGRAAERPNHAAAQRAAAEAKSELIGRGEGTPAWRAEIARHLLAGGLPREAADAAIEAGRRAPQYGLADQGLAHLAFAEGCLLAAQADGVRPGDEGIRARWALARTTTLHRIGKPDEAAVFARQAIAAARAGGDPGTLAMALVAEGDLLRRIGDVDGGRTRLEEAAAIGSKHGLPEPVARASYSLAHLAYLRGDLGAAERIAELAYAASRNAGEAWTALWSRALLRAIALARNDLRGALAHVAEDRQEAEAAGFPSLVAQMEEHAGEIHLAQRSFGHALDHFRRVREVFGMLGDLHMEAFSRVASAGALLGLGRADEAEVEAAAAAELGARLGHAEVSRNAAVHLAHAAILRGDFEGAARHFARIEPDAPLELEIARALGRAARRALDAGQLDLAARMIARAAADLARFGKLDERDELEALLSTSRG